METYVVELREVSKRFGTRCAVDRVSLAIRRGEFFALLGPSGCGKSTLLRLINGFEPPDEGVILLDGADVARVPTHRRDVNMVFQSYALFPHLDVAGNVAFGLRQQKAKNIDGRVGEALARVGLSGYERRAPATLSGGEQQRVALARAIVTGPRVLLLDEPLSALDRKLREGLQEELRRLQRSLGMTFVYVTHDQGEALALSDRIAVMNQGRVEQLGTPREIYERPATRFVAGFVGAGNFFEGEGDGRRVHLREGFELALAAQGQVTLLVRPERMRLGGQRGIAARVKEVLYQGSSTSIVLETCGRKILVEETANGVPCAARSGDMATVSFRPEDATLLPR